MKNIITSLAIMMAFMTNGSAQVQNGGMENWSSTLGFEEPAGWTSSNNLSVLGGDSITCFKVTDRSGGSYACKLVSFHSSLAGQIIPGFIETQQPVSSKPASLRFMYKSYFPSVDTSAIFISLYHGSTYDPNNEVGYGELYISQNQADYTPAVIDIDYSSSLMPDTMIITFLAGSGSVKNVALYLDDIKLSANPLSVTDIAEKPTVSVYPNPASEVLNIDVKEGSGDLALLITDVTGKEVLRKHLASLSNSFRIGNWPAGIYTYHLYDAATGQESVGKLSVDR